MATNVTAAAIKQFEAEVHQAYQAAATLRNIVRTRTGVEGSQVQFPKLAAGTASVRTSTTDVVALNAAYSTVTATMTDYIAAEYSDMFNQAKVNFDERQELAELVGNAIGRREDQIIIDALIAASAQTTVANSVGGSATDLNVAKIRAAKKALDEKSVPPTDRHLIIHASSLSSLLSETSVISSDFMNRQAQLDGTVPSILGFNVHMIGDRDEGGLPKDGSNDRTCLAIHKSACGAAVGIAPKIEINYVPEKTSFLVAAMMSMAAVAIDVNGIIDITCRES